MKTRKSYPKRDKIIKIIPKDLSKPSSVGLLGKFAKDFNAKFRDYLINSLLIEPKSKILVAVSGGIDSVCLLDVLFILKNQFLFDLAVAHLNHKIRGKEADEDEAFVKSLAEKYNLPFFLQRINVEERAKNMSASVEEAGRILRYDFLKRAGQSFSANYIATAHNLNDQAETVLLNIIRGTGIAGLRGIADKVEISKKMYLIRPLIIFTRKEIEEYAKERNLKWREDSTNNLLEYTRNKVRHKLIPLLENEFNPQIVHNLSKLASIAQVSYRIISDYIKHISEKFIIVKNKNEVELDIQNFKYFDNFIFGDLVQYIFNTYFNYSLNFQQIDNLRSLLNAETGKYLMLSREIFVYKNRQKLCFIRKEIKVENDLVVRIPKIGHTFWNDYFVEFEEVPLESFVINSDKNIEFFDYEKVGDEILIRNWNEGDKFVPLGMKQEKKLSDFFVDEKVPLYKKTQIPVFLTNGEIFWVGGLRISEKYKVTKKTKRILKGKIFLINSFYG